LLGGCRDFLRAKASPVSYSALSPEVREIAERVLTRKQLEAWQLELAGWGMAPIGRRLGITKGAVVSRIDGAHLKLHKAGVRQDEFGEWYVEEEVAA
jgi:hypothetical protein